jgi:hypothetical protein
MYRTSFPAGPRQLIRGFPAQRPEAKKCLEKNRIAVQLDAGKFGGIRKFAVRPAYQCPPSIRETALIIATVEK